MRSTRNRLMLVVAWMVVACATACKDKNSVTGPAPTPTPTPLPLSGSWTGGFASSYPVLCDDMGGGTATAELAETGSGVTGTVIAQGGGCRINASIQATRLGNDLTGMATDGALTGSITGTVAAQELRLVLGVLTDGHGSIPGGTAVLHRP